MCFSCSIALAPKHLFEQTATAGDFCLCTDFEQLLAVAPSPAHGSAMLCLWWEALQAGRSKITAILRVSLNSNESGAQPRPGGARSAENQLMNYTGQMWSSLKVIDEEWRLFITQMEDDPGWGTADCMGSSFAHPGYTSSMCMSGLGQHPWDVLIIPKYVHGIYRCALSTDGGINIRNFYHLKLEGPRRLCKYKLSLSKDAAWLA